MKKIGYILFSLLIMFMYVAKVDAAMTARAYINESCNVRTGPGTQNTKISSAYIGSYYTLVEDKEEFIITKEKNMFVVKGEKVERIMRRVNIADYESLFYLHKKLDEIGLNKELKRQGIKEGDIVKIGDYEMEWED